MINERLAQFAGEKYLNLESYRKSGQSVRTPVWFAQEGRIFYCYSEADSFKVKRIRNNPRVRIVPCDVRGKVKGEWVDATARILDEAGERETHRLINRKYGLIKRVLDILAGMRGHKRAAIAIEAGEI
jgi:PPOX class probable F420-dependent enzyme